jgi:hypothetical protein
MVSCNPRRSCCDKIISVTYKVVTSFEAEEPSPAVGKRIFEPDEIVEFVSRIREPGNVIHVRFVANDQKIYRLSSSQFDSCLVAV